MSSANNPPAPKGRGALLLQLLEQRKLAAQAGAQVGAQAEASKEEPPKPKGRAALLKKIFDARKIGAKAAEVPSQLETPKEENKGDDAPTTSTSVSETLEKKMSEVQISQPVHYRGCTGKPLALSCNYIRLDVEKDRGVFEYDVRFNPEVDAKSQRIRLVNQMMREMEYAKVFDGGNCLMLSKMLSDAQKEYKTKLPESDEYVTITIIYKKKMNLGDMRCLRLYNVLFKRIMNELLFTQMGKNYFDTNPQHRYIIPQHKLEIYPGFAVTVEAVEDGLMLSLDTQHRVLRTQNAYELLMELRMCSQQRSFKDLATQSILGSCVFTRYNNRTYIIHDILWDMTPKDTFPTRDGREISFIEYYKTQYNLTISDPDQPMLLHRKTVKVSGSTEKEDRMVCLVPELSFLTGLTDTMRNDFRVMKDVAVYTRITPQQRVHSLKTYLKNVRGSEKAQHLLSEWGLKLSDRNADLQGRHLEAEVVMFGKGITKSAGPGADWTRELSNNPVTGPVDLRNWIVFYVEQNARYANDFSQHMQRLASSMGCVITPPRLEKLPNDQPATYVNYVQKKLDQNVQVAVFICPTMRTDRYSIIKKLCSTQIPIASQVINARTLSKPDKIRAIILKIALQINCKLGGTLWTIKFPFRGWMIAGIDVYHGGANNKSVCGFVSSLNESISRWYSTALFQTKELGDFYKMAFTKSLERYKNENGSYPSKLIIIRDGVSDGELDYTKRYEIAQFENVIKAFSLDITICFVVVQKRINQRIYAVSSNGEFTNPPPGSILDHTVTRRYLYDFFMVPQNVRQGTVNPTHYIVLHDTCKIKPDNVQRLCYKLCHLYYNWPGTVRVPAPCQYAHKLAGMVGQYVKTLPSPDLADKLWYL